ncbi:ankyrin repeat protein, putative [Trichomonas vaginalis G3]|uniref:Ankyrin repeat protein, putative n=1 Tax=Trichomonas vaginalis (strain ATCC PRA-98 / G3) TaxID=412133 RepID=A2FYR1_TRIV3|nr:protein ubiquitination [Trichomonas vaginalis G3]EAX89957.1 ankyrin repeat protein, putative [Trichomonas vaginalis G3]KAI5523680.1 protein ubiquitination [Trichomonas vaginalis G3]|eukprot:XP_001302887.1 ankyrin repeat protein [Trichomonas vaginalis G3]
MKNAIISHNIDFVCFLMNEYQLKIDFVLCIMFDNIQAFFVYLDQTREISVCFVNLPYFRLKSLVNYFMQHGIDINTVVLSDTALINSIKVESLDLLEYLVLNGANINTGYKSSHSPIHIAAGRGNEEIVRFLISLGAKIKNNKKITPPLLVAAGKNKIKNAKILISNGADINVKDSADRNVLYLSLENSNEEMTKYFISCGADIHAKDFYGNTTLHYAAKNNLTNTIIYLISQGLNINEKNLEGKTALHYAAMGNSKDAVELLISLDANIHIKDNDKKPAIHYVKINKYKEIIRILRSHKNDHYGLRHLSLCNIV